MRASRIDVWDEDVAVYRSLEQQPGSLRDVAFRRLASMADVAGSIDRLAALGLVSPSDAHPGTYVAVPPGVGLTLAVRHAEVAFHTRLAELDHLRAHAPAISRALGWGTAPHERVVEQVVVAQSILPELSATARSVIRRIDSAPPLSVLTPPDGVVQRVLYERATLDDLTSAAVIDDAQRRRVHDVRLIAKVPIRVVIVDECIAIVGAADGSGGHVVHPSTLLSGLVSLFDHLWLRASPLRRRADGPAPEWRISDDDQAILDLLAAGFKDSAIARRLGIGLRTVVRRVGKLSRALDAETRFQAGLEASRRGLL